MSGLNDYHNGMTLSIGYKTIFVPADKVSSLINTLSKCSELERVWPDNDEPGHWVNRGDVPYTLTKYDTKEFIVKEGEN